LEPEDLQLGEVLGFRTLLRRKVMRKIFILIGVLSMWVVGTAEVWKNYDEKSNMTFINTNPEQPMKLNPWKQPRLVIEVRHEGRIAPSPDQVEIELSWISLNREIRLTDCREVQIWTNEEKHVLDAHPQVQREQRKLAMERIRVYVSFHLLLRMANAENLLIKIDGNQIGLHPEERQDLRQVVEFLR